MCHKKSETETITKEYTDEERDHLIKTLQSIHGNPHDSPVVNQCYLVMAFTEYEDGVSASIGAFGSDGINTTGNAAVDAKTIAKIDLATLSCSIAGQKIQKKLSQYTDKAQHIRMGAKLWLLEEMEKAELVA